MASRFLGLTLGSTCGPVSTDNQMQPFSESSGADHVKGAHCKTISIYMYLPKITISPLIYRGIRPLGSTYICLVFSLRQLFGEFGRPVSIGW